MGICCLWKVAFLAVVNGCCVSCVNGGWSLSDDLGDCDLSSFGSIFGEGKSSKQDDQSTQQNSLHNENPMVSKQLPCDEKKVLPEPQADNLLRMPRRSKIRFSKAEDQELRELVKTYGKDWKKVSKGMNCRTPMQCRERYSNYLDPTINRNPFTPEEDVQLIELVAENGKKWSYLKQFFSNRTDVALKNRYAYLKNIKK